MNNSDALNVIRKESQRLYRDYIKNVAEEMLGLYPVAEYVSYFPLLLRVSLFTQSDCIGYADGVKFHDEIYSGSKNITGHGYTVDVDVINSRSSGKRNLVKKIYFASENDYLEFVGKKSECEILKKIIKIFAGEFKNQNEKKLFLEWLLKNIYLIEKTSATSSAFGDEKFWKRICLCAKWFRENPKSNLYLRELPEEFDSNFILENKNIIHSLLSEEPIRISFESDHGLRSRPSFIRFRKPYRNSKIILNGLCVSEVSLTTEDFCALGRGSFSSEIRNVVVVKNENVYLTLDFSGARENVLCILGNDYILNLLKLCDWLKNVNIFYLGDMDEYSLSLLSNMRNTFPKMQSLCMNTKSFEDHFMFAENVGTKKTFSPSTYMNLMEEENLLLSKLVCGYKIDSEKIKNSYIKNEFMKLTGQDRNYYVETKSVRTSPPPSVVVLS